MGIHIREWRLQAYRGRKRKSMGERREEFSAVRKCACCLSGEFFTVNKSEAKFFLLKPRPVKPAATQTPGQKPAHAKTAAPALSCFMLLWLCLQVTALSGLLTPGCCHQGSGLLSGELHKACQHNSQWSCLLLLPCCMSCCCLSPLLPCFLFQPITPSSVNVHCPNVIT